MISREHIEPILRHLADRDCHNGCDCLFCEIYERGRMAGKQDGIEEYRRALGTIDDQIRKC